MMTMLWEVWLKLMLMVKPSLSGNGTINYYQSYYSKCIATPEVTGLPALEGVVVANGFA